MGFFSNNAGHWVPVSGNDVITCFGGEGSCIYTISSITKGNFSPYWDVGLE